MTRLTMFGSFFALCLVVAGCSSDGDTDKDASVPDMAMADTSDDMVVEPDLEPDLDTPDLAPEPDQSVDAGPPSAWTEQISGTSAAIQDIWGPDENTVYAVGKSSLIMVNTGEGWSTMTNPEEGDLYSVMGDGVHVLAVGGGVDVYYDGVVWKEGYGYSSDDVRALWVGDTNQFIVGELGGLVRYRENADPEGWWSSNWGVTENDESMYAIWAMDESEVYVVGEEGFIVRCEDASTCAQSDSVWTTMDSGVSSDLRGLWGSSTSDIFAVGFEGSILHYDGTGWTKMNANTNTYFYAVWGSGPNDVYAVGHPIFVKDESIFHYDGTSWTKMPPSQTTYLNTVWGSGPNDVYVGGKNSILHYDGTIP